MIDVIMTYSNIKNITRTEEIRMLRGSCGTAGSINGLLLRVRRWRWRWWWRSWRWCSVIVVLKNKLKTLQLN